MTLPRTTFRRSSALVAVALLASALVGHAQTPPRLLDGPPPRLADTAPPRLPDGAPPRLLDATPPRLTDTAPAASWTIAGRVCYDNVGCLVLNPGDRSFQNIEDCDAGVVSLFDRLALVGRVGENGEAGAFGNLTSWTLDCSRIP